MTLGERHSTDPGPEHNVYSAIDVHRAEAARPGSPREPVTARPRLSPRTDGACVEWALRWHEWRAEQEACGRLSHALLNSRPRLGSRLRVRVS